MEYWPKDVERIRQATGLPIVCMHTSHADVEAVVNEQEQKGWELVSLSHHNGLASLVLIERDRWDAAARAWLNLFFSKKETGPSLLDQVGSWLRAVAEGGALAAPPRLEQHWPWRERRICFLLERCHPASTFEWSSVQPLLDPFFKDANTGLTIVSLNHSYCLLVVPSSILENQSGPDDLLEWASGLHDLISTELMENIRILAGSPLDTPLSLGTSLSQLLSLSLALQTYRPRCMVAGIWQYPLERWAASLPPDVSAALSRQIHAMIPVPQLGVEQMETLETLFASQLNVSDTARRLYVHRNTLLYRLDKLTEMTGLDPRLFPDAVLLQLFLLFRQNNQTIRTT